MTEDWKWMGTPVWSHHGIVGATRDGRVATYVDKILPGAKPAGHRLTQTT